MSRIKPRTLKGFRDFLPAAMLSRERIADAARAVFRAHGFAPIDTPALEHAEVLLGKGGGETEKQVYRFEDNGGRDVALRFDLTVPLARFAAQYVGQLGTPMRLYHIAPVWRAEKPQKGRFREFVQCDFDTLGVDSAIADAETLAAIDSLVSRLGVGGFTIRVNHRGVLNAFLRKNGLEDRSVDVLRAIDKLPKVGGDAVREELTGAGAAGDAIDALLEFAACNGSADSVLAEAERFVAGDADGEASVARLREVVTATALPAGRLELDLSIARGLDYYTGVIFETFLDDLPAIGSICSGGRYDNLAQLFSNQPLPGVGASLGLDRVIAAMEELGQIEESATPARVLMTVLESSRLAEYLAAARRLRDAGVPTEVYPAAAKLGKQLQYADRKGFRYALVAGSGEFERGVFALKDLRSGSQTEAPVGDIPAMLDAVE